MEHSNNAGCSNQMPPRRQPGCSSNNKVQVTGETAKKIHKLQKRKIKLLKKSAKATFKLVAIASELQSLEKQRLQLITTPLPKYPKGGVDMARPGKDAAAIITGGRNMSKQVFPFAGRFEQARQATERTELFTRSILKAVSEDRPFNKPNIDWDAIRKRTKSSPLSKADKPFIHTTLDRNESLAKYYTRRNKRPLNNYFIPKVMFKLIENNYQY